jgi:hypothetical protein
LQLDDTGPTRLAVGILVLPNSRGNNIAHKNNSVAT